MMSVRVVSHWNVFGTPAVYANEMQRQTEIAVLVAPD
jgi:hypothetical protein